MRLDRMMPMLSVADLGRTMAFYCDEIGFRCMNTFGQPKPVWCHLKRDAVELMFNQPPASEMAQVPRRAKDFQVFYFYPDDVVALQRRLSKRARPRPRTQLLDLCPLA